jgi:hypothetical protein
MKTALAAYWIIPEWRRNVAAALPVHQVFRARLVRDGSVHAMLKKFRRRATLRPPALDGPPDPENKSPAT